MHHCHTYRPPLERQICPPPHPIQLCSRSPKRYGFHLKSMQLSIKKFIVSPQLIEESPSRAAIFVDLTNMFNAVSREELFDIINTDFPELSPLTHLLYSKHGDVFFKWNQDSWRSLQMKEGVNQQLRMPPITNFCNACTTPGSEALRPKTQRTCGRPFGSRFTR